MDSSRQGLRWALILPGQDFRWSNRDKKDFAHRVLYGGRFLRIELYVTGLSHSDCG